MKKTYVVEAKRGVRGCELNIEGVAVAQARNLRFAEKMARAYISLVQGIHDESTIHVEVRPQIEGPSEEVIVARKAVRDLFERQREFAMLLRAAATEPATLGCRARTSRSCSTIHPQQSPNCSILDPRFHCATEFPAGRAPSLVCLDDPATDSPGPQRCEAQGPNQNVVWGTQIPLRRFHGQALRGRQ